MKPSTSDQPNNCSIVDILGRGDTYLPMGTNGGLNRAEWLRKQVAPGQQHVAGETTLLNNSSSKLVEWAVMEWEEDTPT